VFNYEAASDKFTADPKSPSDCGHACHTAVKAKDYIFHPYQKRGRARHRHQVPAGVPHIAFPETSATGRHQSDQPRTFWRSIDCSWLHQRVLRKKLAMS